MKSSRSSVTFFASTRVCCLIVFLCSTVASAFIDEDIEFARTMLVRETDNKIEKAFFSPGQSIKKMLLGLIKNETQEICAALFRLTDPDVAQALSDAFARGVKISLITDYGNFAERYEKVTKLFNSGIPIRYYVVPYSIMHHKFYIFMNNFLENPILVAGSANSTKGGLGRNFEDYIVTNSPDLLESYHQQFVKLEDNTHSGIPKIKKYVTKVILHTTKNILCTKFKR
ncbi:MAG: Phospholipase D precursor [Candidatus Dependentiae bacterium ADurb.Bin331]|nr:MAG: Phospholipase D precursor [Candidatus Dependentiae bacterium ADurb.Bin331]